MNKLFALGMGAAFSLAAAGAQAATIQHAGSFDNANSHLYQLFGTVGLQSYDTPAEVDAAQITNDQYWSIQGSGAAAAVMLFEISANSGSTTFGIFDASNPNNRAVIWNGTATPGVLGSQRTVSILGDGSVIVNGGLAGDFAGNNFGFYIQLADGTIYYSDEALNPTGADQMVTFQGNDSDILDTTTILGGQGTTGTFASTEYILAWEDILASLPLGQTDNDYNDLVIIVESVEQRVPEPTTLALFGAGLLGLGMIRRRKA